MSDSNTHGHEQVPSRERRRFPGDLLPRLRASRRPVRAGGAAEVERVRHRLQDAERPAPRVQPAPAVPVRLGAGERPPVRAPQRHAAGRLLRAGPGAGPADVRPAGPGPERHVHRARRADHRADHRPGRTPRRGGDAGGHRPRGGARPVGARLVPHDPAVPHQLRDEGHLDPARQHRGDGDRDGVARVVPQVGAGGGPGRTAGGPGPQSVDARPDEAGGRQAHARDERGRLSWSRPRSTRPAATCATPY